MIFPTSFEVGIGLLILSLLCWGSWPSTFQRAGKWRYELFYFDFSAGFLLLALIAAFTFGTMNATELTFRENFLITGYRKMAFAVGAGVLFNIANLLMTASVASAGMSVAFILALGTATVVGVVWDFIAIPDANAMLMFGGAVLVLAAVVAMALAYSAYKEAIFLASKKAALQVDPRTKQGKRSPQRSGAAVGIVVGIFSGILFGFFPPLMNLATEGENGVSPYGSVLLAAVGLMFSTVLATPFMVNFPVAGAPVRITEYFRSKGWQHMLGWLGGALLCCGVLSAMVVASSPAGKLVGPVWGYALGHASPLVTAILGMLIWRELRGSTDRSRNFVMASVVLFAAGIALVAVAPLYTTK